VSENVTYQIENRLKEVSLLKVFNLETEDYFYAFNPEYLYKSIKAESKHELKQRKKQAYFHLDTLSSDVNTPRFTPNEKPIE
jgi:hypothetical protein